MFSFRLRHHNRETERWLEHLKQLHIEDILHRYGDAGVAALSAATPYDTGRTASSWSYEIERDADGYTIVYSNSHFNKGVNIAIILQYGHGTGTGGYVQGIDYINPSMRPVFEGFANDAWNEVRNG